ncbi:parathyroid hormone 2 receptor-like [Chrysoperla carnea]|uniref:parathyroid hormone 2 receptor-like n=1 Tax=Chrysoperla carnea TaxID=189513 RepID=UPI001D08D958|nr:parathyroid hormone 2 receptor-like [Chrysoperla carnea]
MTCSNVATKYCLPNGSWYYDEKLNQTWTNYSQCLIDSYHGVKNSTAFRKWFPLVKTVSQTGYSVSLTTLIIAIIIFSSIKKLRCARNRLHLHLFISFSMRAFMALLKDALFLQGVAMSQNLVFIEGEMFITEPNAWICKLITTSWEYFILANYTWILMEGLYLHNLIFTSLFSDNSAITMYVCFGWGVPSFFTIAWAVSRIYYEDTLCWTTHKNKLVFMLIRMPIVLSVFTSFILFLNIVRVLLVKLNSVYIQRRKVRYRRLVRSTLVLVPLFGVHYSVFLAMSYADLQSKPMIMLGWLFCDQFFSSFQGFCVAMLYCLLNGEVRAELKRKYTAWKYRERGQRFASYATMSFRAHSRVSIPLTEIRKPS